MPVLTVSTDPADEGSEAVFTFRLDEASLAPVTVSYRVLTGAELGSMSTNQISAGFDNGEVRSLTFNPGETVKTVSMPILTDSQDELDETFTIEVFDPINAELAGNAPVLRATGFGLDNDGPGNNIVVAVGSPVLVEGDNGTSLARFEIRLSQPLAADVALDYTTLDGSALAGSDYVAKSGTLNLLAGQVSAFVDVEVNGDNVIEDTETFFLKVTPPGIAPSPATSVGKGTIVNDDTAGPGPSISIDVLPADEGSEAVFTFRLDEASLAPVTVSYRVLTGAELGSMSTNQISAGFDNGEVRSLTFNPGETVKTVSMPILTDSQDELDETFTIEVFDPINAELAGNAPVLRATGFGLDNDGPGNNIVVAVGSPVLVEGDNGTSLARFEIRLSQPLAADVALDYTTLDGSALAGSDYVAKSGTLNLLAGQVSAFVDVEVNGDNVIEDTETFFLKVTPPGIAPSPATSVGKGTIVNDDTAGPGPSISIDVLPADEGSEAVFTFRLDEASLAPVTVSYRVLTGAELGSMSTNQISAGFDNGEVRSLTFNPGETVKTVSMPILTDSQDELDETFTIEVFDPINAELAGNAPVLRATGFGLDNDGPGNNIVVAVGSPVLVEGDNGTSLARFEIRLSQPLAADVALDYTTLDGSALAGSDYVAKSGTLNLLAGQVSAFVDVEVNGDNVIEDTETFFLKVTPPGIAPSPATSVGKGTIVNDDTAGPGPSISIDVLPADEGSEAVFTFRLDEASLAPVTVSYRVLTGAELGSMSTNQISAGFDNGEVRSLTFNPGETVKTVSMPILTDSQDELDETFTIEVFDPINAELAGNAPVLRATGFGLDNDGPGNNIVVAVGSPVLVEGDNGTSLARFEIRLSQPLAADVALDYTTLDGSALAGSDYVAKSGTLNLLAGQVSAFVDVFVNTDLVQEDDETFSLVITPPGIAPSTATNTGVASIKNDDDGIITPPPSDEFRLFAADGFAGSVGGRGTVFGTAAFQSIAVIDEPGSIALDPSFNRGGDLVQLTGDASDWIVTRVGSSALFSDGDTFVTVPVGTTGLAIRFDDGLRTLIFDGDSFAIGGQAFGIGTLAPIDAVPDGTTLPPGADPAAKAVLFIAANAEIAASGVVDIFGAAGNERVSLISGNLTLDASFNRGGDTIAFDEAAADYVASQSGSSVRLTGSDTTALIPVGISGATLAFGDGSDTRNLLLDTGIPGITIGGQLIGIDPVQLMAA